MPAVPVPRHASGARRDDTSRGRSRDAAPGRPASGGRAASGRGDRERERPREDAEPGFGPFRGRQRDGAPGGGPKRKRVDDEAQVVRTVAEEAVARAAGEPRPALRIVHGRDADDAGAKAKRGGRSKGGAKRAAPPAAQRPKVVRDGNRLQEALIRGARDLDRGYEAEAIRVLRPWREAHPDSSDLRELLGLAYYRSGKWTLAQKELQAFVELTDSVEQHPVLMDCARSSSHRASTRLNFPRARAQSMSTGCCSVESVSSTKAWSSFWASTHFPVR